MDSFVPPQENSQSSVLLDGILKSNLQQEVEGRFFWFIFAA